MIDHAMHPTDRATRRRAPGSAGTSPRGDLHAGGRRGGREARYRRRRAVVGAAARRRRRRRRARGRQRPDRSRRRACLRRRGRDGTARHAISCAPPPATASGRSPRRTTATSPITRYVEALIDLNGGTAIEVGQLVRLP